MNHLIRSFKASKLALFKVTKSSECVTLPKGCSLFETPTFQIAFMSNFPFSSFPQMYNYKKGTFQIPTLTSSRNYIFELRNSHKCNAPTYRNYNVCQHWNFKVPQFQNWEYRISKSGTPISEHADDPCTPNSRRPLHPKQIRKPDPLET